VQFQRDYQEPDDLLEEDGADDEPIRFMPPGGRREWPPVQDWGDLEWTAWLAQHAGWTPPKIARYLEIDRFKFGLGFQRHPSEAFQYFYLPVPAAIPLHKHKSLNLLFGGAVGGSKSHATRWDAYRHLLQIPKYNSLLMRRTHSELERNHTNKAVIECAQINDYFQREVLDLTPSQHKLRVPHMNSMMTFGHCQNSGDEEVYLGDEYDDYRPDEMATFEMKQVIGVASRLRSTKRGSYGKVQARLVGTTNPGGAHTSWIADHWIRKNVSPEVNPRYVPEEYTFIPSSLYDNPWLMDSDGTYQSYEKRLYSLSRQRRKQLLQGDWDAITGQYFDNWDPRLHVGRFEIPDGCQIECCIDWGYDPNPGVCCWVAMMPNGRLYVFAEWIFRKLVAAKVAKRIFEMTRQEICTPKNQRRLRRSIGDPSMWARSGQTGESLAETFARHGVPLQKGDNDRVIGWGRLRHWLGRHPDGKAWMVFDPDCQYAIRTLPSLIHDEADPEDLDTTGEDHLADSIRYLVCSRPTPTTFRHTPLPTIPDSIRALVRPELAEYANQGVRPFGKIR
jgi:phage terminase large subunit